MVLKGCDVIQGEEFIIVMYSSCKVSLLKSTCDARLFAQRFIIAVFYAVAFSAASLPLRIHEVHLVLESPVFTSGLALEKLQYKCKFCSGPLSVSHFPGITNDINAKLLHILVRF